MGLSVPGSVNLYSRKHCPSKRESHQFVPIYCNHIVGSRYQWTTLTLWDVSRHFNVSWHFKDNGLQIGCNLQRLAASLTVLLARSALWCCKVPQAQREDMIRLPSTRHNRMTLALRMHITFTLTCTRAWLVDWAWFYYFVRNSLLALPEALCAQRIISRALEASWGWLALYIEFNQA